MIFMAKNGTVVLDTLNYIPSLPNRITSLEMESKVALSHLKVNNSVTFNDEKTGTVKPVTLYNPNGDAKNSTELYDMLSSWDDQTLLNAFFTRSFEAGNIGGGGEDIDKLLIKRLSPDDSYSSYSTIGEVKYDKDNTDFSFEDHFIKSGEPYLYTIQPVTEANHYGAIQSNAVGLNQYEYSWLIDRGGFKIQIIDCEIGAVSYVTKDGIVETIGGETPYVTRYSNLDYKTFSISGTIASEFDETKNILNKMENDELEISEEIRTLIGEKYIQKIGEVPTQVHNSMRYYSYERRFREEIINSLKNGQVKLFKSPTEGLILVKLTSVSATPINTLGRVLYKFSATATEVGRVDEEALLNFREGDIQNG